MSSKKEGLKETDMKKLSVPDKYINDCIEKNLNEFIDIYNKDKILNIYNKNNKLLKEICLKNRIKNIQQITLPSFNI